MGIRHKLLVIFGLFVILFGGAIGATIRAVRSEMTDGVVVALATRQGMLTQRMSKDALALSLGVEEARARLAENARMFDSTLKALASGGSAWLNDENTFEVKATADEEIVARLKKVEALWERFHASVMVMLDRDADLPSFAAAAKYIEENNTVLLDEMGGAAEMYAVSSAERMRVLMLSQVVFFFLAVAVSAIGFLVLTRIIVRPIGRIVALAGRVADGDLTAECLEVGGRDEMSALCAALNRMRENLGGMVGKVKDTSAHVVEAAFNLSTTMNQIVKGADVQTANTDQVVAAMEEMSATVGEVARNSQRAADSAGSAQKTALRGGEVVAKSVEGMMKVAESVRTSATTIEDLGNNSVQIGEIVAVINDIADQTNLLALNAAIEAARAGDQGRGFAVVADEVRKLAEKTSKATGEIAGMIKNIQGATRGAIASMHEGTRQTEEGVSLSGHAGDALREIVASVEGVTGLVAHIAIAAEEQSSTTEEISRNIGGISEAARSTSDGVRQVSVSIEALGKAAEDLNKLVGGFIISGSAS
jgi:methyl-accepting chemotaxis protein